jgi:hypothetical protein
MAQAALVGLVSSWTNPNGCLAGHRLPKETKRTTDVEEEQAEKRILLQKAFVT